MVGKVFATTLAMTMLWCAPGFGADAPKSADDLIGKYVDAIGGRKAIDSIHTIRFVGKTIVGGGIEAPLTVSKMRPNKIRTEIEFQGMKLVTAFDGTTGWMISPFAGKTDPEKMGEAQLKILLDQADFDGPLIDYKKKGNKVELMGEDEIEGTPTYKLKVTKKSGSVEYYHLDKEYFILLARTSKFEFQGSEIESEEHFGDYKPVGGRLFAHSIESKAGMMGGGTVTFDKIEVNPKIDSNRFVMPKVKPESKKEDAPKPDGKKKGKD